VFGSHFGKDGINVLIAHAFGFMFGPICLAAFGAVVTRRVNMAEDQIR
jgi:hypothetical protein